MSDQKLIDMVETSSGIDHILDTRNIPYGKNKGESFEYKGFEYFDGYNTPYECGFEYRWRIEKVRSNGIDDSK